MFLIFAANYASPYFSYLQHIICSKLREYKFLFLFAANSLYRIARVHISLIYSKLFVVNCVSAYFSYLQQIICIKLRECIFLVFAVNYLYQIARVQISLICSNCNSAGIVGICVLFTIERLIELFSQKYASQTIHRHK